MEERNEKELYDGGLPTASSSDSCPGTLLGDTASSPLSYFLAPGFKRFECESTVPAGFEWCTCDLTVEECCADVCGLLMDKSQKEGEDKFLTIVSTDFIRWSCCPPGYLPACHIGIWDGSSRQLVAFAAAVPIRVRVMEESSRIARIYFPMVRKNFRDRIPTNIVHDELIRRIRSVNIRWIVKRNPIVGPAPMAFPVWKRPLNSKKLFEQGYFKNVAMTLPEITKSFKMTLSPDIREFKIMNGSHVQPLTGLLREYLRKFKVAPEFDEDAVKHWFLSNANLLHSYVHVGPDGNIIGFFSFMTFQKHRKDVELTIAFLSYNFTMEMTLQQQMKCAIVIARLMHCDVFLAYERISNRSFLTELRFSQARFHIQYEFDLDGISNLRKDDIGLVLL